MIDEETKDAIAEYAQWMTWASVPFAVMSAIAVLLGLMFWNETIYGYGGLFVSGVAARICATAIIVAVASLALKSWAE